MDSSTGPIRRDAGIRTHVVRQDGGRSDRDPKSGEEFEKELEGRDRKTAGSASERRDKKKENGPSKNPTRPSVDGDVGANIDVVC